MKTMKTMRVLIFIMLAAVLPAAAIFSAEGKEELITGNIRAEIIPGKYYSATKWFGIFPVRLTPQIAVWAETLEGDFLGTVYVSRSTAEDKWKGAKQGRPEALPVFLNRASASELLISDTVSGATPKGKSPARAEGSIASPEETFVIFAEVNRSFDYNEYYPKSESGVNGQPSLVYKGIVNAADQGKNSSSLKLAPFGTGSVDGTNGNIQPGTDRLTTALDIVREITVTISYQEIHGKP